MNIKLGIFILIGLFMVSCSDDTDVDQFIGNWNGSITCPESDPENFSLVISAAVKKDEVNVAFEDGPTIPSSVNSDEILSIPRTVVPDGTDTIFIQGSGRINDAGSLLIDLDLENRSDGEITTGRCTATLNQ